MSIVMWPLRAVWFLAWYAWELVSSNVQVIWDNVTPGQSSTPGIVRLVTHCRTDAETTMLAMLITLTPGTLTLGASRDGDANVLIVHGMYATHAEELRADLYGMERRMLGGMRPRGFRDAEVSA